MRPLSLLSLLALVVLVAACDSGPGGSLYDPDASDNSTPLISSVSPEGVVLAGIDEITITGQNFSPVPSENLVFFDDATGNVARGTVLAASATELRVKAPNLPNPNLRMRISVRGAENFSNAVAFPLTPAIVPFGDLDVNVEEEVFGLTPDGAGGIFASMVSDGSSIGIKRFSADGTRSDYFSSTFPWYDLTVGADGELYGARRIRALFRLPEGGSQQTFVALPSGVTLNTIATSSSGAIWTAGSSTSPANAGIYRVSPDGATTLFPFSERVVDLVVFEGSLYAATPAAVWRFPIGPGDALGEGTPHVDLASKLGTNEQATALAFAADGTIFIGTNAATDPMIEVPAGGEATRLYPGVLTSPVTSMAWGPGSILYLARPPFGDAPASLQALETRREGAR